MRALRICSRAPPPASSSSTKTTRPEPDVPYIYFNIEIDNPDDNAVAVSDLRFRYYFNNDLTTPVTDFYSPQTKDAQGITHNLDADALVTYMPTYLEVSFTTDALLNTGDSLMFQVHMHSDPNPGSHNQSMDYSYSPLTTLMPWCHVIVLYQLDRARLGYATARLTACYAERWRVAFTL